MHHIFGHVAPDTDAIVSAFVFAHYLSLQGVDAHAYRLGNPNPETQFVIDYFFKNFKEYAHLPPALLDHLDPTNPYATLQKGDKICLTDHNDPAQSIRYLSGFEICHVIDHHKLSLSTSMPTHVRIAPVGCTCTILFEMFGEKSLPISPPIALLMLLAIASDTLNLTSPITTDQDRHAMAHLTTLAGITTIDKVINEMFVAKSNLAHLDARTLLLMDCKEYVFGNHRWAIAGIETLDPQSILQRRDELSNMAWHIKQEKALDHLMIVVVDIGTQTGYAIADDDRQNLMIQHTFHTAPNDDGVFVLHGVISRKKQLVPAIERYYQDSHAHA